MNVLMRALAAIAALSLAACEVEEGGSGESIKKGKDEAASAGNSKEAPDPDGRFSSSCDVLLSSDIDGQNYFAGSAKMRNVGNIGIVVRVRLRFAMVASENVTDEKMVRLDVGRRRTVKFRIPATVEQVSEHQSSPDYFNGEGCAVTPKIVDSFGRVKG